MSTVKEIKENLDKYYKEDDYICCIIWQVEDVKCRAENYIEVTDEECEDILARLEHKHDACYGISWETIDCYLWDLKQEREKENELERKTD
jgi:hypothetical protein